MPKFVIERDIPGAGKLSPAELHAISQKSSGVLRGMGPQIQWVESYVNGDKVYCIYVRAQRRRGARARATRRVPGQPRVARSLGHRSVDDGVTQA